MLESIYYYESVKNNFYLRASCPVNGFEEDLQRGEISYTWTLPFDEKGDKIFDDIYKTNKSRLTYSIRWISAIPMALWDVIVCSIARLFLYIVKSKVLKEEKAYVEFYHIGKNFEMAGGRIWGMLWDDKEGIKIVHRAALDKRFYTIQVEANTRYFTEDKSYIPYVFCELRDRALCEFYAEAVWNRKNIKRSSRDIMDQKVYDVFFEKRLAEFKKSLDEDEEDDKRVAEFNIHYKRLKKIKDELIPIPK